MSDALAAAPERRPLLFEEYFETGQPESASPFLTPSSRSWGKNVPLKTAIASAILLVIAFSLHLIPNVEPLGYLVLILVYFFAGIPSLIESIEDISNGQINIDVLMTLAAFGSVLIGSPFEGGLLLVLFAVSGAMEDAVATKAKGAITALHRLSPSKATVIQSDGTYIERSIRDINVGTEILVKSGEVVPLDGIVTQGISTVNLVHLTGENLPQLRKEGDSVPAGGRNLEGSLVLKVTHTSADSTLSRIIQLVTEAQEAKPKLQKWFDSVSKTYATTIILLAFAFAVSMPYLLQIPWLGIEGSIYRSLAFLIAASPCALIIAIPIAYLSAVSICARRGILLKGGVTLDALAGCKIVAFDKTGTVTTGELECLGIEPIHSEITFDENLPLAVAYAMELNTVHPIARALLKYAQAKEARPHLIQNFKTVPGYGLEASLLWSGCQTFAYIGNAAYILDKVERTIARKVQNRVQTAEISGELAAILLIGKDIFLLRFRDTLRPNIKPMMEYIQGPCKMRVVMLTGDHWQNARTIAHEAGIREFHADLRPEDKMEWVSKLAGGYDLAMVGDGINDAPALARAAVGICMGKTGSGTAIEAADIILLQDNIDRLGWLFQKARQTQRIVRENLILATAAILIATLPSLLGFFPLWLAVVMHEGGTVLVGLNALRLLR